MSTSTPDSDTHRQVVATHRAGDVVCLAAALLAVAAIVGGVSVWVVGGGWVAAVALVVGGVVPAMMMWLFGTWAMAWAEVHQT